MNDQTQTNANHDNEIDLLELLSTILEGKVKIIFLSLLFLALAFIYAFGQLPVYSSDALLQVEKQKAAIPGIEDISGLGGGNATIGTELEIIKSRKILGNAVKDLKLDNTAYPKRVSIIGNFYQHFFNPDTTEKPFQGWKIFDSFIKKYSWGNEKITLARLEVAPYYLNTSLTVVSNGDNKFSLFNQEKLLLDGIVGVLNTSKNNDIKINISELEAQKGTQFIIKKHSFLRAVEFLQRSVQVSEKGKKTGIINLALEGRNKQQIVNILNNVSRTYLEQNKSRSSEEASNALSFLEEQIKPVKEKAEIAEANLKYYRTSNQTADMSMETRGVLDVVSGIDTELQRLSLKRDELKQKYTPNHPIILAISSQENKLKLRKNEALSKISKLPETQQELLKLERNYKVANTIYLDLLNNIQEFKIAKASSVGNVYIVDSAVVHDRAVKPRRLLILAIGGLLGFLSGLALVFIKKAMHRTINNPEKLEENMGIPVYATIPLTKQVNLTKGLKKNKQQKSLLANEKPLDPAIESLRSLRTSLHFALLEAKNNIVMITGPSPGIGKSFISSNFAAVISTSEQRVLLIDADMRKGYLHNLLNKSVSPGLSDLISDKTTLEEAIHTIKDGDKSFDIITRGQTPPNPSELLMHSNFEKLLNKLSAQYDLILIDTPPVLAVTDPTIIGKHSGVVFMVVRSDQHSMKEIEHSVTRLSQNGIDTKGFIFNGYVAKKSGYGYGGYGYHSYYGDYQSDK